MRHFSCVELKKGKVEIDLDHIVAMVWPEVFDPLNQVPTCSIYMTGNVNFATTKAEGERISLAWRQGVVQ